MDIATLNTAEAAEEGQWLELVHPTTYQPLDIRIKLLGTDSKVWRKHEREVQNKRLQRFQKRGAKARLTMEEAEAEALDGLAKVTQEWQGMKESGKDVPCTRENARRIYQDYPWIREQVDEFVGDRGNFLPPSGQS